MKSLLLIEDHEILRVSLADELREAGFQVDEAADSREALQMISSESYTAAITDMKLPGGMNGIEILERIKLNSPETVVLIITAFGSVSTAVEAMKKGADDYLTKPFETEELLHVLNRSIRIRTLEAENIELRGRLDEQYRFEKFIGISEPITRIKENLRIAAPTDETILIEGETGTGKEVLARVIHENSKRRKGPYVTVSCASLHAELLESELFGHEKGAFTGAYQQKTGRFELAFRGTIFLDEVDDIPLALQVKLLRVLQEKEFTRVGGSDKIKADIRVIAATKQNLKELIRQERFREDLYYRLNVIPIYIPPLRERPEDILSLIEFFLSSASKTYGEVKIEPNALQCLLDYEWPGNVRQLENVIKRIIVMGQGRYICKEMIPQDICDSRQNQ